MQRISRKLRITTKQKIRIMNKKKIIKKQFAFRCRWEFHQKMKEKLKAYNLELEADFQKLSEEQQKSLMPISDQKVYKKVAQICKKTGFELQIFDSHLDAGKKLSLNPSNILKVLHNGEGSCGGYYWKYFEL